MGLALWLRNFSALVLVFASPSLQSLAYPDFGAAGAQQPWLSSHVSPPVPSPQAFLDVPVSTLSLGALSASQHTTLAHPAFPAHQVRIKRTEGFCDTTVNAYTGYIDAAYGTRHLFFYFFESRGNPDEDDIVMWINGGPGGSSITGLLRELGPCNIDTDPSPDSDGTKWNPHSWNTNANIFFLDQPAGVGWSYDDFNRTVDNTPEAAEDVDAFLRLFFATFSSFQGRPFHMSGESYGGRYIPLFASKVYDNNKIYEDAGAIPINLQSILIGNGFTNIQHMVIGMYKQQCTNATISPVTDIATCIRMKAALPRCIKALDTYCVDVWDDIGCQHAGDFCFAEILYPYINNGHDAFDITRKCDDWSCSVEENVVAEWVKKDSTHELLGIDSDHRVFQPSGDAINIAFSARGDSLYQTQWWVAALLERSVDVLIYAGTYDFACNWINNLGWLEELEWSGKTELNAEELGPWYVGNKVVGQTKAARNLVFATVDAAGHMVPHDKPVESLAMLQRWLRYRRL